MINNKSRYQEDYNEAMNEDSSGLQKFLQDEREKAQKSYPEGEKIKRCSICNEPLVYGSISYEEGCHIDNCI